MKKKSDNLQKRNTILLSAIVFLLSIIFITLIWYIFDVSKEKPSTALKNDTVGIVEVQDVVSSEKIEENKEETLDLSNKDPEVGGVVEKVSKHMLIPVGDVTVATVNDAEALRRDSPVVFKYVKNGDKVLMYDEWVIIYDPAVDKIVDSIRLLENSGDINL